MASWNCSGAQSGVKFSKWDGLKKNKSFDAKDIVEAQLTSGTSSKKPRKTFTLKRKMRQI